MFTPKSFINPLENMLSNYKEKKNIIHIYKCYCDNRYIGQTLIVIKQRVMEKEIKLYICDKQK